MHLNDPRERVSEANVDDLARFYFSMLTFNYEAAISGLMHEFGCAREEAVRRLASSYERLDREKLEALKRQSQHTSRRG